MKSWTQAVSCILECFDQQCYVMYQNLEELLLKAVSGKDYSSHLQTVIEFYGDDFSESELSTQLQIFSSSFPTGQQNCDTEGNHLLSGRSLTRPAHIFFTEQLCWVACSSLFYCQPIQKVKDLSLP